MEEWEPSGKCQKVYNEVKRRTKNNGRESIWYKTKGENPFDIKKNVAQTLKEF